MKPVVLLYWFVHGWICLQRPWMALPAFSALLFSSLFHHKRRVHARSLENNPEQDSTRAALKAAESVRFRCSTILSFAFFLRFLLFAYCLYWILWLGLSMLLAFGEHARHHTVEEAAAVLQKVLDLWAHHATPYGFALIIFDVLLSSFQIVVAYGFYIVQAWNVTNHNLYAHDPWTVGFYWAMAAALFYIAYAGASSVLISIILLTHIHNFFSQLQSMLNEREDFFGKRLILLVLWSVERISFGIFKVGVPGFILVAIVGGLVTMLFIIILLSGVGALDPPSNIHIE